MDFADTKYDEAVKVTSVVAVHTDYSGEWEISIHTPIQGPFKGEKKAGMGELSLTSVGILVELPLGETVCNSLDSGGLTVSKKPTPDRFGSPHFFGHSHGVKE